MKKKPIKKNLCFVSTAWLSPAEKEEFAHPPLWNSQIPSKVSPSICTEKKLKKSKKEWCIVWKSCNCFVAAKTIPFLLKCHFSCLNGLIFHQTDKFCLQLAGILIDGMFNAVSRYFIYITLNIYQLWHWWREPEHRDGAQKGKVCGIKQEKLLDYSGNNWDLNTRNNDQQDLEVRSALKLSFEKENYEKFPGVWSKNMDKKAKKAKISF